MIAIKGTGVSGGIAEGSIFCYKRVSTVAEKKQAADPSKELERWKKAAAELDALAEKTRAEIDEEAMLFETHRMMLDDLDYTDRIEELITSEKYSAEKAVDTAGKEFSEMFAAMDDDYMRARSIDVTDISNRVVSVLSGTNNETSIDKPSVILADDLTPSETVQLDKSTILGFILTGSNANSHTAILARTLGIPAIINADIDLNGGYEGRQLIMDGSVGYIVIDPDETTKEYLGKKQREEKAVILIFNQSVDKKSAQKPYMRAFA